MVLCLVPTSVFAEGEPTEGSAAIQLGANALSKNANTANAPTVYFGQNHENHPGAWRIVGYDGTGAAGAAGNMTLLAAYNMGLSYFGASTAYADSNLKEAIDTLAGKLTAEETAAIEKRMLASGSYDGENTDCVAGSAVSNAVFWPLSTKEANAVNADLRVLDPAHPSWASSFWWLRSPGESDGSAAIVGGNGIVRHYGGYSVSKEFGARPAFHLNLNAVLFVSAAVHRKVADLTAPIAEYTGSEWKLTLHDSERDDFTAKTALLKNNVLPVEYDHAKVGENEYLSAVILDADGSISRYARIAQLDGTNNGTRGRADIDLSDIDMTGKTLCVFNEQFNGDYKTDYASAFVKLELLLDEQFTLTPGGRYYFDLSAAGIPGTANDALPDTTLHYVPFTYVGTVDAYKLTSAMTTTEEYAEQNQYAHSLFVADHAVTCLISWDDLNTAGLIFGKDYSAGGAGILQGSNGKLQPSGLATRSQLAAMLHRYLKN